MRDKECEAAISGEDLACQKAELDNRLLYEDPGESLQVQDDIFSFLSCWSVRTNSLIDGFNS